MRKATVKNFTSTAINDRTKKLYRGVYLLGSVYFEGAPEGTYSITVRKPGFNTTIRRHEFSCEYSDEGFAFVDILMLRGSPSKVVKEDSRREMRLDRITRIGAVNPDDDYRAPTSASDATRVPKQISGGVLNGKALILPKPAYPPAARAVRASGAVSVQVLFDETGNVISASAVSGHPLLQAAAVQAAREAKFSPVTLQGQPVKVSGVITYNFIP